MKNSRWFSLINYPAAYLKHRLRWGPPKVKIEAGKTCEIDFAPNTSINFYELPEINSNAFCRSGAFSEYVVWLVGENE